MTEQEQAKQIAESWLDFQWNQFTQMVRGDPDCDAVVLARQFVRLLETYNKSSERTSDRTGWLIEKDDPPVYAILSDDYDEHWTPDASLALRFARQEDAQAYSDHIGWTSPPVRTTEHMWPEPRTKIAPRGGVEYDWQEWSLIYLRRLRALTKLICKEGYAVRSDGNGMPYNLEKLRDYHVDVSEAVKP